MRTFCFQKENEASHSGPHVQSHVAEVAEAEGLEILGSLGNFLKIKNKNKKELRNVAHCKGQSQFLMPFKKKKIQLKEKSKMWLLF